MWLGFAVLAAGGLLFIVLGWLALNEKLPRNHIAGIRTPYTMRSEENWYATHRAAAPLLIYGGVAVAMAGLAFLPFAAAGKVSAGVGGAVMIAMAAVAFIVALASWLYGTRAARGSHT